MKVLILEKMATTGTSFLDLYFTTGAWRGVDNTAMKNSLSREKTFVFWCSKFLMVLWQRDTNVPGNKMNWKAHKPG